MASAARTLKKEDKILKKCFKKHFLHPGVVAHHALLEQMYHRVYKYLKNNDIVTTRLQDTQFINKIKGVYQQFMNIFYGKKNIADALSDVSNWSDRLTFHYIIDEMLKGGYISEEECTIHMKSFHND